MKRQLFLFAMLAIASVWTQRAWAQYSTSDLVSAGWEAVDGTTVGLTDLDDYYFVLVDGTETNKSLTYSGVGTDARPVYQLLYDPTVDVGQVWKLEASGEKFKLKSYVNDYYYCANSWGWNSYMGTNESYTEHEFALADGKYHIYVTDEGGTKRALGAWNNYDLSGGGQGYAGTAGNKDVDGSNDRGFYIYRIARTSFTPAAKPSEQYAAKGWKEVTASEDWGVAELQYVLLDYSETGFETDKVMTATENGLPQYKHSDMTDKAQWWLTEAAGDGYALKSVEYGTYSNYTAPWGGNMSDAVPGNVFVPSLADGKWAIKNTSDNNNWLGRWGDNDNGKNAKNDPFAGEQLASNKGINNGRRLYNVYAIPSAVEMADPLPESGVMAADTWYFFDIAIAGSTYAATATTLADIECIEYPGITVTLTATDNTLAATRYYVKSSSANKLVVAATSYSYTIGEPTANPADGSVIKPGKTISVAFEISTNDPSATVTADFSGVTFGGNAVTVTHTADGFKFAVPDDVTAGTEYVLSVPAGAVQYAGEASSEAASFTYHTPVITDGVYYFRNTDPNYEYKYLARGGHWATQAVVNDFGLATYLSIGDDGTTTIQFFDNDMYLGDDGFCYTDCTGGRVRSFLVEKVEGGYKFKNTNNNKYFAIYQGQTVADAEEGGNLEGATNVWALETTAEYTSTCYARNTQNQVVAAATAAGLTGITTGAALEAAFESSKTIEIPEVARTSANDKYGANSDAGTPYTYFEKEVTGLNNGVYKLTFKAMQRGSAYERVDKAEGARGLLFAYANDAQTQLVSSMEQGVATAYASNYYSERTGLNYPNNSSSTYTAFDNGLFDNEVWVYVSDGTLKFGIKNPSRLAGDFHCYTVYGDFGLTYYYSLSSLVNAYHEALAAAKTTVAKEDKMATSLNAALGNTIALYDEGRVDETNQAELEEAIGALLPATQKCETSIASYAIIAAGSLPDDSVDGWAENNNGDLKINTWSGGVSNDDGGSGMTTPFIENWHYRDAQLGAGKLYYHLEGLEPGETFYVEALIRACNEANNTTPNGPVFYANDETVDVTTVGTVHDGGSWSSLYGTVSAIATVGDDGVLEFGFTTTDDCNYNWHAVKNVKIVAVGNYIITDDEDYDYTQTGMGTVGLIRTIVPDDYNTMVLPFEMNAEEIEAAFGEGTHVYLAEKFADNNISLRTPDYDKDGVGVEKIMPNVPFVIKPTLRTPNGPMPIDDGIYIADRTLVPCEVVNPSYEGDKVTTIGNYSKSFTVPQLGMVNWVIGYQNLLEPTTGADAAAPVSTAKLYYVNSEVILKCSRAYFALEGATEAKAIGFDVEGESTGIAVVDNGDVKFYTGKAYDLSGREVKNPSKGLYIIGGKKVMIK